ncbi:hypothetical protein JAO29_23170, partial [Edaphobacter sp. HDX4]|uniref:hypothetical protein n=1 Tax=Edaphobacter sp. HDX4 TaxID=2794064 RepID=UPI002FE517C1
DHRSSEAAYARVQDLTRAYNQLESGKWEGMMDSAPRARQVFYLPVTIIDSFGSFHLPGAWNAPAGRSAEASCAGSGQSRSEPEFREESATVSMNAAHFARAQGSSQGNWQVLERLGVSGSSVALGAPGLASSVMDSGHLEKAPWIEY